MDSLTHSPTVANGLAGVKTPASVLYQALIEHITTQSLASCASDSSSQIYPQLPLRIHERRIMATRTLDLKRQLSTNL